MSEEKTPKWVFVSDIILGIIAILTAFLVVLFPSLAIQVLILIIAIGLLILALARILRGIFSKLLSNPLRALNVAAGLVILVAALIALILPALVTQLLIWILAFGLLIIGAVRLATGGFASEFPNWLRALLIIIGIVTIILSVVVFALPLLGEITLIILLAYALLSSGIGRVAKGIVNLR